MCAAILQVTLPIYPALLTHLTVEELLTSRQMSGAIYTHKVSMKFMSLFTTTIHLKE